MLKKIIVSGLRPTGKMHLGNFLGTVSNWFDYQKDYKCFFMIADWHALTTEYKQPQKIKSLSLEMLKDWLSLGINPEKSTIFIQSQVKAHLQLYFLLSMITPLPWLERNPTYKDLLTERKDEDLRTFGFLGYPVLQAADILIYKANIVPVGLDQLPHIELTREIAKRFNFLYKEIFPLPESKLTETSKLLGIDGRKMSKSYNNCIYLSDEPKDLKKKIKNMITDPARIKKSDLGHPDVCSVFQYQQIFNKYNVLQIKQECENATIGCVDCKENIASIIINFFAEFREIRKEIKLEQIEEIIEHGNSKAQKEAEKVLKEVNEVMQF
ncbi:MAG: tryptophan--tRNA ligase [bacterium]